jgi:amino acid transporter
VHIKDLIFWSVIAFAWTGPEAIAFMGGEIARPRRTIPIALAIAAPAIAIIYIAGTLSLLVAAVPHYDVLVSSTVIITLLPFLLLFASALKLRGAVGSPSE